MSINDSDNNSGDALFKLTETKETLITGKTDHRDLINYMISGYTYCRVIFEDGVPVDFCHEEVNAGYEKLTGLKNVAGQRASEVFPGIKNNLPEFIEKQVAVAKTGIPDRFELYFEPLKSWFDISVYCPQKGYFVSIFDDITKRKKAEERLREREERFRILFENLAAPMMIIDPDTGHIIDANHAAGNFYGWSIEELSQMHMQQISTLSPEKIKAEMKKCSTKAQNQFLFRNRKADGSLHDVDVISNTIDIRGKILLYFVHDCTERKRYESLTAFRLRLFEMAENHSVEELLMAAMDRKADDKWSTALFNAFPQAILLLDHEGKIIVVNNAFKAQFNNHPEITQGSNIFHSVSTELGFEQSKKIDEVLFTGKRLFFEKESDGQIYRHTIYPIPNNEGEITNLLMFIKDVTILNKAEIDLLEERVQYRNLFNSQSNGFAYCRLIYEDHQPVDFIPEVVNMNFTKLTGIQTVNGRNISVLIPGISKSNPDLFEKIGQVARTGVADRFDLYINTLNKWLEITAYSHQKGYFVMVLTTIKTINIGNWEWNLENEEMIWSDKLRMLLGLDLHTISPSYQTWLQSIVPGERIITEKSVQNAIEKGVKFEIVYNVYDGYGSIRQMMTHGFPVINTEGVLTRYMGISIDISEYKNDDSIYLINTNNFSDLLNSSIEPLCSIAIDGTILDANEEFLDIYSIESRHVIGEYFHNLFPRQLEEERKAKFELIFYTRKPIHFQDTFRSNTIEIEQNEEYIYQISAYPIYGKNESINSIAVFITNSNKKYEAEKSRKQ